MTAEILKKMTQEIVSQAKVLKDKYTTEVNALVNYACVFAESQAEYQELTKAIQSMGPVIKETNSGLLYHITDIETVAGPLRILKIRLPDPTRPERGDADFTVADYQSFKQQYLTQPNFKLITRPYMEMIELMEPNCNVRTYFSNPPLDKQLL